MKRSIPLTPLNPSKAIGGGVFGLDRSTTGGQGRNSVGRSRKALDIEDQYLCPLPSKRRSGVAAFACWACRPKPQTAKTVARSFLFTASFHSHFFAFSPISTSRRMARGVSGSSLQKAERAR